MWYRRRIQECLLVPSSAVIDSDGEKVFTYEGAPSYPILVELDPLTVVFQREETSVKFPFRPLDFPDVASLYESDSTPLGPDQRYEQITVESTAPHELAALDCSREALFKWVTKYGIPWSSAIALRHKNDGIPSPLWLIDAESGARREILHWMAFATLQRTQEYVRNIVEIWRMLAAGKKNDLRCYLLSAKNESAWTVFRPADEDYKQHLQDNEKDIYRVAVRILQSLINVGSSEYPLDVYVEFDENEYVMQRPNESVWDVPTVPALIEVVDNNSALPYIWEIIRKELCSNSPKKGLHKWHYKQCANPTCGAWFDIAPPTHRNSRKYCLACSASKKWDRERKRAERAEQRAKNPPGPRGRPKK